MALPHTDPNDILLTICAARTFFLALSISSAVWAQDRADLSIVHRIRAEAFQNSQVMDTVFYLSDVHGPRVTNSTGFKSAAPIGW